MNSTNKYSGVSNNIATSKGNTTDSMTTIAASRIKNRCFIDYPTSFIKTSSYGFNWTNELFVVYVFDNAVIFSCTRIEAHKLINFIV